MKAIVFLIVTVFGLATFGPKTNAQNRWHIDSLKPAEAYVRNKFDIIGGGFGTEQSRGTTVLMKLTEHDLRRVHKPRILSWSSKRIRLEVPDLAIPGRYSIGVYHNDDLLTNEITLTVLGGIVIRAINPNPASPGNTIEIRGVHFGDNQVNRYVSINRLGTRSRLPILDWSDNLIRAQVPNRIEAGTYLLLIYYDETRTRSSDGMDFTIQSRRD